MSEPLRVLIVEDNENDALLVLRELRGQGFEPAFIRIQDPDALARALDERAWDVVLSDYSMPGFTGADALRIMQDKRLDLPFIVISGTVGEDIAVQTMKAGAHDYLMKGQLGRLGAAIRREREAARTRGEKRQAEAKLRHVNRVLRAIRDVNQLIVREKDPDRLLQQACDTLIETRGYGGAWIAVGDTAPSAWVQAGWGEEAFEPLVRVLEGGQWPRCRDAARRSREGIAVLDPRTSCEGCPLRERYGHTLGVVTELRRGEESLGLLGVSFPHELVVDEEERSLLLEVAGDIAFALHDIELERQRGHYEQIVASSSEAMALVDRGHVYLEANPSYQRLVGATGQDLAGRGLPEVLGQAFFHEQIKPRLDRCFAGEELRFETERQVSGLEPRIVDALYTPCRAPDGTVSAVAVCIRNVTEQRKAEEDRLAESLRARQYLDIAGVILLAIDCDGVVTMINEKGCEVLGYPEDEIVGRSWFDNFVTPEVREEILPVSASLLEGRPEATAYHENTVLTRSGEERLVAWNNTVVRDADGAIVATLSSGEDITERRGAEDRIRFLGEVVEQTPDGILCTDTEFKITYMNRAAETLFGWTLDEVRGKAPDLLNADPAAREIQRAIYDRVGSGEVYEGDALNRRKDGSTFVCQFKVAPVLDDQGDVMAYMGAQRDVTEHRKLEAARRQALRETEALLRASRAVLLQSEFPAAARAILEICAGHIGAPVGDLTLLSDDGERTDVLFLESRFEGLPRAVDPLRERAFRERRAVLDNTCGTGQEAQHTPALDAVLLAPLVLEGQAVGLLGLANKPGGFDEQDAGIASAFAEIAAIALREDRTREALCASEMKHRTLFDSSADAIMTLAPPAWRFTSGNPATIRMFGARDEADFISRSPWEYSPERQPDGRASSDKAREMIETAMRQGAHLFEWQHRHLDGEAFPATVLLTRMELLGEPLLQATVRDITERKRYEAELRANEERFRAVFKTVTDGILLADKGRSIVMVNDAICRMLGYSEEELLRLGVKDIHPAEDLPRVARAFEDQLAGRLNVAADIPVKRSDGSIFYADINSAPVVIDGRELLMGCFRDVTEKRALQVSVAQSDRLASMGMLAAGVAHEINNPLTYVLYNLQSLAEDLPGLTEAVARLQRALGLQQTIEVLGEAASTVRADHLDDLITRTRDAEQGACRVRDIVKELKIFTRVDEERAVPVSLNDAIETAINMAFNEIKYRARLVKDYGELPTLMANDGKLAQVFLNLLVNAAHAIEEGDVEHNEIRVRTWTEGEHVMVEVGDTGQGIAEENRGRLFEPFFTTKEVGVGSGLGLSICHNIVSGLGGSIEVESEPGVGTRFLVTLPVTEMEAPGAVGGEIPDQGTSLRGRLLIVDDEAHVGEAMARMLEGDHEAVVVTSGQEAMRILEEDQRFDAIISDLMMPDITGMDLHEWLVQRCPTLAERMLFITGGAFTPRAKRFLYQVKNPRLEKPFDPQSLRAWLRQIVSASRWAATDHPTAQGGG